VDITRLINRTQTARPAGIDRTELAYANFFIANPAARFVVQLKGTVGILPRHEVERLLRHFQRNWIAQRQNAGEERRFEALLRRLSSPPKTGDAVLRGPVRPKLRIFPETRERLRRSWLQFRSRPVTSHLAGAVYINVGQVSLKEPADFAWLARTRTPALLYIHDLFTIERGVARPERVREHKQRLATVHEHAAAVLVNSHDTAQSLGRYFRAQEWQLPSVHVVPNCLEPVFLDDSGPPPATYPYFVTFANGTPRKNTEMLVDIWRQLVTEGDAPRLLVLGKLGKGGLKIAKDEQSLAAHVIHAPSLEDARVRTLLAGASALLMPSFAEGYGRPIAEGLAARTPVLASDLPALRETGGHFAQYLNPYDRDAWLDAVRDLASPASKRRAAFRSLIDRYRPPSWNDHFPAVMEIAREVAERDM
jgi:glycosyltransferase involved in cell wall biosynthesis